MFLQTWLLPIALLAVASIVAFPLSRYCAWVMDGNTAGACGAGWNSAWTPARRTGSSTPPPCWSSTSCCSWSATWCWPSSPGCR